MSRGLIKGNDKAQKKKNVSGAACVCPSHRRRRPIRQASYASTSAEPETSPEGTVLPSTCTGVESSLRPLLLFPLPLPVPLPKPLPRPGWMS